MLNWYSRGSMPVDVGSNPSRVCFYCGLGKRYPSSLISYRSAVQDCHPLPNNWPVDIMVIMPACLVGQRSSILLRVAKFWNALLAQWNSATVYEAVGCGFESYRGCQVLYGYGPRDGHLPSKQTYAGSNPATRAKFWAWIWDKKANECQVTFPQLGCMDFGVKKDWLSQYWPVSESVQTDRHCPKVLMLG